MKKSNSITLILCCGSMLMTSMSMFDKFLSPTYVVKMGLALSFPVIAMVIAVIRMVKKTNQTEETVQIINLKKFKY
ncbi:MAG: hypothetical protein FWF72_00620 [Paludibacter sp.]|nr:hypothetical protein [Paludibacter sp.]